MAGSQFVGLILLVLDFEASEKTRKVRKFSVFCAVAECKRLVVQSMCRTCLKRIIFALFWGRMSREFKLDLPACHALRHMNGIFDYSREYFTPPSTDDVVAFVAVVVCRYD